MSDAQSKLQICRWIVKGQSTLYIPSRSVVHSGGNRVGEHERPHRPGARLDGMGPRADRWTIAAEVFDSDAHVAPLANKRIYPDLASDIIAAMKREETGTLVTPTEGRRRCKAHEWQRTDGHDDARNIAVLRLVFVEDNEDDDATAAHSSLGAYATIQPVTFAAVAELEKNGATNPDVAGLSAAADQVANLLSTPEQYASEAQGIAESYMAQLDRVMDAFTTGRDAVTGELRGLLTGSDGSHALALLTQARDSAAGLLGELAGNGSDVVPLRFGAWVTLVEVAGQVGQDVEALAQLNPDIVDPFYIKPGTPIRVRDEGLPRELRGTR